MFQCWALAGEPLPLRHYHVVGLVARTGAHKCGMTLAPWECETNRAGSSLSTSRLRRGETRLCLAGLPWHTDRAFLECHSGQARAVSRYKGPNSNQIHAKASQWPLAKCIGQARAELNVRKLIGAWQHFILPNKNCLKNDCKQHMPKRQCQHQMHRK